MTEDDDRKLLKDALEQLRGWNIVAMSLEAPNAVTSTLIDRIERHLQAPAGPDSLGYAKRLAANIWFMHYQEKAPDWKPQGTLIGVLTQIDNMVAGL
jgi:hypothetical protein